MGILETGRHNRRELLSLASARLYLTSPHSLYHLDTDSNFATNSRPLQRADK